MAEVELIDFSIPAGPGHVLYLPGLPGGDGGRERLWLLLHAAYSEYGLLYQVTVADGEDGECYAYVRFYSARAASRSRAATSGGEVFLLGDRLRVSKFCPGGGGGGCRVSLPLPRHKCETLANHYLGFSGWSSRILYHRREDDEEEDPLAIKFVSVVRLEFRSGLSCEGAGLRQEILEEGSNSGEVLVATAKRSLGEAFISAWSKVLLVVVGTNKVMVEIDTTRKDSFFYDPTWDTPLLQVQEADYTACQNGECVGDDDDDDDDDNDEGEIIQAEES